MQTESKTALAQENFSTPLNMAKRMSMEVGRKPALSRARVKTTRRKPTARGLRQFRFPQIAEKSFRASLPRRNDLKKMAKATRKIKLPAKKERKPDPGSRKVPSPKWTEPTMVRNPKANQKRLLSRSAFNLPSFPVWQDPYSNFLTLCFCKKPG